MLLVIHGEPSECRAFLQRLRTQKVDVDRAGRPCKERQAAVRWQAPLVAPKAAATLRSHRTELDGGMPDNAREALAGWGVVECGGGVSALRSALEACGIRDNAQLAEVMGK